MRLLTTLFFSAILFLNHPNIAAQQLSDLQNQWTTVNNGSPPRSFDNLITQLLLYRRTAGGMSWQVDYMLGSSYCQTHGKETSGKIAIERVIHGYGVPDDALRDAKTVLDDCKSRSASEPRPAFKLIPISGHRETPSIHGKGGYEIYESSTATKDAQPITPLSVEVLQKRVFKLDQKPEALSAAKARLSDPNVSAQASSRFITVFRTLDSDKNTSLCLEQYVSPLVRQFGMELPKALITIYLFEPKGVSMRLHGVSMPLGTIAYSVNQDLSIVGTRSHEGGCGTLAHELVHLAIRQNFGDSPSWLEEGLASEVAVSHPEPARIEFQRSWRDEELKLRWSLRPQVRELLLMNWSDFVANSSADVKRVAARHAMAACFVRYLDSKQKLVPVYAGIRDNLDSDQPLSDQQIVEQGLGMKVEDIDSDFKMWFSGQAIN